jgi:hypothetical protein
MADGRVDDPDREDPATDPVVGRLTRVKNILTRANERLDRIAGVTINPSDPDVPEIRRVLGEIRTEAQSSIAKADAIERLLPP